MAERSSSATRDRKRHRSFSPERRSALHQLPSPLPPTSSPSPTSTLTPQQRHTQLISIYRQYHSALHPRPLHPTHPSSTPTPTLSDADLLLSSPLHLLPPSPHHRLALRYYTQLYKEYALVDLTHPSRPGLRWRTEGEVVAGKGQWLCGAKGCGRGGEGLRTWRVRFGYEEKGGQGEGEGGGQGEGGGGGGREREVDVKVRLCEDCAVLLHWDQIKEAKRHAREMRRQAKERRKEERRRRRRQREQGREAQDAGGESERRRRVKEEDGEGEAVAVPSVSPSLASLLPPPLERPPPDEWAQLFP